MSTLPGSTETNQGSDPLADVSFLAFANEVLGFKEVFKDPKTGREGIYEWQEDAVTPFDEASDKLVQVSVVTPNGSGKSAVIIPTLVLGWLTFYPKGRVVVTTADGKQLDGQVMPAINAHRAKFPTWKFIEREIRTPGLNGDEGGFLAAFTTDQAGRAEGWHKLNDTDGPLLVICDEAKTIPEDIYTAIDRCTYNAILLTSSPGTMFGRFYNTQTRPELGYVRIKAGLLDCPHISPEKIERLVAMHGPQSSHPNPQLLRSTLHGEFMMAEGEAKFDHEGLEHMKAMAEAGHARGALGVLQRSRATGSIIFMRDPQGWLWLDEMPVEGGSYLVFCDPNTCEQGEGTTERDNTACGVIREGGLDDDGTERKDHVVAALYWPEGVKWDSDVLGQRMQMLSAFFGKCMVVVEANNFGSALIKVLQQLGVSLWQRIKIDDVNPNKQVKLVGFLTTNRSRTHWVEACAAAIREKALVCRFKPACDEFQTFIIGASGKAEAQAGFHDDWVAGIGIGLSIRCFTTIPKARRNPFAGLFHRQGQQAAPTGIGKFGACG